MGFRILRYSDTFEFFPHKRRKESESIHQIRDYNLSSRLEESSQGGSFKIQDSRFSGLYQKWHSKKSLSSWSKAFPSSATQKNSPPDYVKFGDFTLTDDGLSPSHWMLSVCGSETYWSLFRLEGGDKQEKKKKRQNYYENDWKIFY